MKPQGLQEIYDEIVTHINNQGGAYAAWYCGIASNRKDRLFKDHQVPRKNYWWITRHCQNNEAARKIEGALIKLGCDGDSGGGGETTVYVYAYLKGTMTNP